jgi:hypothetical protein
VSTHLCESVRCPVCNPAVAFSLRIEDASATIARTQRELEVMEEKRRRYSGVRGFMRMLGEITLAGACGILVGLALAWLAVTLAREISPRAAHAEPLPDSLALYAPVLYDPFGVPGGVDTGGPYPRLWVWPRGPHNVNLTGVKFAFWNPPPPTGPFQSWTPASHRVVWLQYWSRGELDHAPAAGDTLWFERGGFVVAAFHPTDWVDDPVVTTIESGWATFTAVTDSVIEGKACMVVNAPSWSAPRSDTTWFRLAPETYRPGVWP